MSGFHRTVSPAGKLECGISGSPVRSLSAAAAPGLAFRSAHMWNVDVLLILCGNNGTAPRGSWTGMRQAPRLSVELSGWVIGNDGQYQPCLVANLSSDGAKLTVLRRDQLPAQFTLSVESVKHRSKLVWRTGLHAGVQFLPRGTARRCLMVPLLAGDAFLPFLNGRMAHPAGDRGGSVVSRVSR